ncbi:MAG: hypothetical protein KatS3mg068_1047 [Candidatus Sericytochromatia bacterium]|nr:MAG: hypothetical protein KatS3mg068_1047 [Candidatus Sericytochromatia bacterium]
MKFKVFNILFILILVNIILTKEVFSYCSNPGKDGVAGPTSSLLIDYYPGTGNPIAGSTSVTVGASRLGAVGISPGDLLLIIQMQDGTINYTNNANYGANDGTGRGQTSVGNAGLFEYAIATNSVSTAGGTINLASPLVNSYINANATATSGQKRFQVIRVPQYSSLTLSGTVTAPAWNGNTGGVLAFDVAGILNFNGATIDMTGKGFRGGGARQVTGGPGGSNTDYVRNSGNFHASKGEGIAGTPRYVYDGSNIINTGVEGYPGGSFARGAPGNAGGGGTDGNPSANDQNSGGGGGSNFGAGGQGGNTWYSNLPRGGLGGAPFPASPTRMVMGGGGGAGTRNNSSGVQSSGGLGGGMVFIRAGTINGSTGTINANGTTPPDPANDGAGGGGAGGSVLFYTADNNLTGITINARGANGANSWPTQSGFINSHGPGGGGGGGYVTVSSGATINIQNGSPGYTTTDTSNYFGAPTSGPGAPSVGDLLTPVPINTIPGAGANPDCLPNLTVTKTTSTPNLTNTSSGITGQYTITVSNAINRGNAEQVNISDLLPSGFTYLSTTSVNLSGGATRSPVTNPSSGSTNPNWGVFTIPGGGSVTITFNVNIPNTIFEGTFQNPAQAQYLDPQRTTSGQTTNSYYIATSTNNEDITITSYDYGDAPDTYLTINSSNGARHIIKNNIKLGALIDIDNNGQPNTSANGDDSNTSDDEDSISTIPILYTNASSYSVNVLVTNNTGSNANLRAWIDFNLDGVFQSSEASSLITVPNGTNNGTFTLTWLSIPTNIQAGNSYLRVRLTTDSLSNSDFAGLKNNGEVEDYTLTIQNVYDYGDASNSYLTLNSSSGARHAIKNNIRIGSLIDSENDGLPGISANGDDNDNTDDEDGVTSFPLLHTSFSTYSLNVNVYNNTGNNATLYGWIDFDRDGIFQADEATSVNVPNGTNGNVTLTWNNIGGSGPNIVAGDSYVRLRLTTGSISANDTGGTFLDGEVEDYTINISNATYSISGRVFEDINYGGGAGRNFTSASGVGRPNVRVELYNSAGNFVTFTTTNASGIYTFSGLLPGNYTVRVVNSSVTSSRPGGGSGELGVQTFRTDVSSGIVVDITNMVGGQDPTKVDAGNGSTTLSALNTSTTTAQSITNVYLVSNITGVDFGFNFDTIVNTNNSGQGSLRQFILNSNALGNSGLAQVGQTPGKEVSIFMIPNGVSNPGQNTSYTNQLTSYGAARIILSSALPDITAPDTIIDGRTQTNNVRTAGGQETNIGQTAGNVFVGVSQTYLPPFDNPEVEIVASNIRGLTTTTAATGFELRNIAFVACGVLIQGNNSLIQDNLFGMQANGVESTVYSATYFVELGNNSSNMIVRHNYVKTNNSGIRRDGGGSNMLVEYNEVTRPSTGQTNTFDGILIIGNGLNDTIQYNYVHHMRGAGSELGYNPSANVVNLVVQENTYSNNGKNLDGNPSNEPINIIVRTIGSGSVVQIYRNIISDSGGAGIVVQSTNRVRITENSIFRNGLVSGSANLGIDLRSDNPDPNTLGINLDGVTPNDGIINSSLANNGTDYPIITSAILVGDSLHIKGYVGSAPNQTAFANSLIEVFKATDDGNNNGEIILGDGKKCSTW